MNCKSCGLEKGVDDHIKAALYYAKRALKNADKPTVQRDDLNRIVRSLKRAQTALRHSPRAQR